MNESWKGPIPPVPNAVPIQGVMNQQQINEVQETPEIQNNSNEQNQHPAGTQRPDNFQIANQPESEGIISILREILDLHNFLPQEVVSQELEAVETEANGTGENRPVGVDWPKLISVRTLSPVGTPGNLPTRNNIEELIRFVILYGGPAPGVVGGTPVEGPLPAPTNIKGVMVLEILASSILTHTHDEPDAIMHCTRMVFVSRAPAFEDEVWRCRACRLDHPEDFAANEWSVHVIHLIGPRQMRLTDCLPSNDNDVRPPVPNYELAKVL
ncbi:hypothetical protein QAD02_011630 [Eretmocerus hayati]|uniref:Uncharacterized protein n=1 Tax=Eretmocerus hayati TaxID=131215 RepID=A0ACC2NZY5_9HYME|nr:hypothetical protein QAD02_011630 [Eretmocerus hayati]